MAPIEMFWIILMVAAVYIATGPISSPAATTDPVLSTVPPIQAPASTWCMPTPLAIAGKRNIMIATKTMDRPMASVSSSFLARQAAAQAIAADTPDTDISAEMVMFNSLDGILTNFCPNQ